MRIHLLSTPNTQTTRAYYLDGFCLRTILFARLLKRLGHEVILYGIEDNEAECDHFISVLTKEEQKQLIGDVPYQSVSWEANSSLSLTYNAKAANHLRSVKDARDIICTIGGSGQMQIAESHPELPFLEYSVGYSGVATRSHRVYQSVAWQHIVYGFTGVQGGRLFDTVIPPWFLVEEFPFEAQSDPYVVYCGRLIHSKGLHTVCEAARHAGVKLLVMGHGIKELVTYGEYLGTPSDAERNAILSKAQACLMPTMYVEPFGNVAAEAQLCGTPMITTDYGGFTESVEQGQTGYRCTSLGEFVEAIHLCRGLDRKYIRARAVALWSEQTALASYHRYFNRLKTIQGDGWNTLLPTLSVPATGSKEQDAYESQQFYPGTTRGIEEPALDGAAGPVGSEPLYAEATA